MHATTTEDGSYWLATTRTAPAHPSLIGHERAGVAVVGGGIAGVTTALLLARAGADVALVEADRVGSGVSGNTTAKVTSAHGHCYGPLTDRIDADHARAYGEANERALAWMSRLVMTEGIACDWRMRAAWTYTIDPGQAEALGREADCATASGLRATLRPDAPLPFEVAAAVCVEDQAECHARRYVLGLAGLAERAGARIFEHSRVTGVTAGGPCIVRTREGELTADRVVVATHFPILDRGLFFARLAIERSYCVAARATGPVPEGMFFAIDTPSRSLRTVPLDGGGELVIAGGEGHESGADPDTGRRYRALWEWLRRNFEVEDRCAYRWSAQDPIAPDGLPYAGPLHPASDRLFVITGLRKWGFTNGTAAAHAVVGRLQGRPTPEAELFSPTRVHARATIGPLVKKNAGVAWHLVTDRVRQRDAIPADELPLGEGAMVDLDGRRAAGYRDGEGTLHAVSPRCSHLGCEVAFNPAERSWDCPCHGSRFDVDGEVLEGPATAPLEPLQVPARPA